MADKDFPPASTPRASYNGVRISRAQFFDLMLIALALGGGDGTDEPPWDLKMVADNEGFLYEPEWISDFVRAMENGGIDVIMTDSKSGSWPEDRICAYPNTGVITAAPPLKNFYYGTLNHKDFHPHSVVGKGLLGIPASDGFVSIKHNQPDVDELVDLVEEVTAKAPTDNLFCTLVADPDDRVAILSEWKSLSDWLKLPKVNKAVIAAMIPTLMWIASELAGGVIGELAKRIVDGLTQLLGL